LTGTALSIVAADKARASGIIIRAFALMLRALFQQGWKNDIRENSSTIDCHCISSWFEKTSNGSSLRQLMLSDQFSLDVPNLMLLNARAAQCRMKQFEEEGPEL
jgi:hypothetical protein